MKIRERRVSCTSPFTQKSANGATCQSTHYFYLYLQSTEKKQENIPVGCVPPALVATTRCQYWCGEGVGVMSLVMTTR